MPGNFYKKYGKRIFDLTFSLIGIIILSPFFLILVLAIWIIDGKPVIFKQVRMGKDFKKFTMFKLRTMIENNDKTGPLVTSSGDSRITSTGRLLRRFKLDEFPQLFNVIRGDISFVGPRPEIEKFVNYFKKEYGRILSVHPGITDEAALRYKDESELLKNAQNVEETYVKKILPQKINLYLEYIENITFRKDVLLIWKTLLKIFR